jgi:hypothetical protein
MVDNYPDTLVSTSFLTRRTVLQAVGAGAARLALPAIGQSAWPSKAILLPVSRRSGATSSSGRKSPQIDF